MKKNKLIIISLIALVAVVLICVFFIVGQNNEEVQPGEYVSIYLTCSADAEYLNKQKTNTASGSAIIYDKDGEVLYDGALKQIKGRGNTSWTNTIEQKPYNIKLEEKAELIKNGGAAKKWCLLCGDMYDDDAVNRWVFENPNLTNLIGYNFFADLGGSNPLQCIPAQLYINGDYRGCYLLSEAVQIAEGRVEVGDGGVVLELDNSSSRDKDDVQFETSHGNRFLFKDPDDPSDELVAKVQEYIQDFENALYSADGLNLKLKYYSDYIDMESFAIEMATRVLCADGDIYLRSEYWTLNVDENGEFTKITAGPVWDFDCCTYNNTAYMDMLTEERLARRELLLMFLMHIDYVEEFDRIMSGPARELMEQYASKGGKIDTWVKQYADVKAESFKRWPQGIDWNASKSTPNSAVGSFSKYQKWYKFFYKEIWDTDVLLTKIAPIYVEVKNKQ